MLKNEKKIWGLYRRDLYRRRAFMPLRFYRRRTFIAASLSPGSIYRCNTFVVEQLFPESIKFIAIQACIPLNFPFLPLPENTLNCKTFVNNIVNITDKFKLIEHLGFVWYIVYTTCFKILT